MRKLTDAQRRALENLAAGRSIYYGIYGMSAHGGMTQTIYALRRRGYLDRQGNISQAGQAALATDKARESDA